MTISWYTGNVAEAVEEAKVRQANLLVFVRSDDEYTRMYDGVLNSLDLSNKIYIAISLDAYTDAYEQLKAVYRIVPVPSILVIDWESGMVMERIAGPLFDEELQEIFLDAISNKPDEPKLIPADIPLSPASRDTKPPDTTARIQFKLPTGQTNTVDFALTDTLGDIRMHVKNLFSLRKAFELAIPYPRKVLTEDNRTIKELGLAPAASILVTPQEKIEKAVEPPQPVITKQPLTVPTTSSTSERPTQARIQFKHKSGEVNMQIFEPSDSLENIRKVVRSLFEIRGDFDLVVPYPRRILGVSEDSVTLEELGLCPTSTVLVLPHEEESLLPWNILQTLGSFFQPIFQFFIGLWRQIFGGPRPPPSAAVEEKKTN